jgi:hypothetical protein
MRKELITGALILFFVLSLTAVRSDALDNPHGDANTISCATCHNVYDFQPALVLPNWVDLEPQDTDDSPYNLLCWSCHNSFDAPYVKTHSSLATDDDYGDWAVE